MPILGLLRPFLREENTLGWPWPGLELLLRPGPSVFLGPTGSPHCWDTASVAGEAQDGSGNKFKWRLTVSNLQLLPQSDIGGWAPTILEAIQGVGAGLQLPRPGGP